MCSLLALPSARRSLLDVCQPDTRTTAVPRAGRSPLHYAYEELGNIHEAVKWLVEKTGSPVKYDGPTQLNDDGSMRANLLGDIDVGAVKSEYGEPLVRGYS